MSRREWREQKYRQWTSLTAVLGGLLWIPYGVFEMLQPWEVDAEFRNDKGYEVVIDAALYRLYNLPGSVSLLLTAVSLLGICHLLVQAPGAKARVSRVLGYVSLVLGVLSLAGAVAGFDPLFTGPRIFGTMTLGAATLLPGITSRRASTVPITGANLVGLGLLSLFLFPLWPLVYAVELVPAWLGATIIAAFGLGWALIGY